jgi:quercetin dioxygenase-like cupin family protein
VALEAGGCARLPRNVPHGWRNVGEGAGRLVLTAFPAGVEGLYDALEALSARIAPSTPKAAEVAAIAARYGVDFLSPLDRGGHNK